MYSRSVSKSLDKAKRRVEREKKAKIREEKRLRQLLSRQIKFQMITNHEINWRFLLK